MCCAAHPAHCRKRAPAGTSQPSEEVAQPEKRLYAAPRHVELRGGGAPAHHGGQIDIAEVGGVANRGVDREGVREAVLAEERNVRPRVREGTLPQLPGGPAIPSSPENVGVLDGSHTALERHECAPREEVAELQVPAVDAVVVANEAAAEIAV